MKIIEQYSNAQTKPETTNHCLMNIFPHLVVKIANK